MIRNETLKLFELLEQLYPNRSPTRDNVTVAIWTEVLKPWTYPQVRDAVIRRARRNNFCPTPAELSEYLPPVPQAAKAEPQRADRRYALWLKLYHEAKRQELARVGLAEFAGRSGAEYLAWRAKAVEAGIDLAAILEATRKVAYGEVSG